MTTRSQQSIPDEGERGHGSGWGLLARAFDVNVALPVVVVVLPVVGLILGLDILVITAGCGPPS
jgi:hypothetical protein